MTAAQASGVICHTCTTSNRHASRPGAAALALTEPLCSHLSQNLSFGSQVPDAIRNHAISKILVSQKNVKSIRISVKAEFFGVDYAKSQDQERFVGKITQWKVKRDLDLMVLWEGYQRGQSATLANLLGNDTEGNSIDLILEPYDNGDVPPTLIEAPQRRAPAQEDVEDEDEEGEVGDEDEDDEIPDLIDCHGQVWNQVEPTGVKSDARKEPRHKPSLTAGQLVLKGIVSLFFYLLPPAWIDEQLKHTNPKLQGHDKINAKLDKGELLQWWGYALALSLHSGMPIDKMWSNQPMPGNILPPPRLGDHGMTMARWKKIRAVLCFGPSDASSFTSDRWCFVRLLVEAFNNHMANQVAPGWLLCVDELMVAWRGKVGEGDPSKCPWRSWVPRKPEPLGVEMKATACALSGLFLFLEICEGKVAHEKQKWFSEHGHTTATTLRITEPWHGSDRVVAGDSWFAGVKCAEALGNNGLYFIGDIKTNTRRFPIKILKAATPKQRGSYITYTSELKLGGDKTMPIYAVSHCRGADHVHAFVATCGTTLPGKGRQVFFEDDENEGPDGTDHVTEVLSQGAKVHDDMTLAQPAIDRGNRYRQFILAMEKRILTNRFDLRFGTSMFGILLVNVFFAERHFNNPLADFKAEMSTLAYALMHNDFLTAPASTPTSRPPSSCGSSSSTCGSEHQLMALKHLPYLKKSACKKKSVQMRCVMCNKHTSWCCGVCSSTGENKIVAMCPATSKSRKKGGTITNHCCIEEHRISPTYFPRGKKNKSKRGRLFEEENNEKAEEEEEEEFNEEEEDEEEEQEEEKKEKEDDEEEEE